MSRKLRLLFAVAIAAALASAPAPVAAQAFTPPRGLGAVTLAWQYVDNTGHRFSDGFLLARGQSVTQSALVELDYGVTDRLSATAGIPYVFARYTGAMPPPSGLPVDACGCWHSSFQDFSLAARYRLGHESWAVTPVVRYLRPSHDYAYKGEAVVGRNLQEAQVGVSAGARLTGLLPRASVQAGYTYSFVEKPLADVPIDRSIGFVQLGYAPTPRLYVSAVGNGQRTHGGLRVGSPTGHPFPVPGELNTAERFAQRDRLLRANYLQVGGGLAYAAGAVDVFASFAKYVWGRNAHNGQDYNVGATWYFRLSK
ncbi:MAG: hypothetical protein DMF80_05855 [Acidobacteria bacterium]|nr:MAG: hypothetical protein DMF80_05855 [Acidobacteriota bacterium]PYQ25016.1 MAG: hypothetical protein DMF81_03715 [Acidobacteriota bacterium]